MPDVGCPRAAVNVEAAVDVSVISSVYNEEGNLAPLVHRVVSTMESYPTGDLWEYLLVDDASTDGSRHVLNALSDQFPGYVRVLSHPTRQGQKGCFMTGFAHARGRIAILLDADLQVLPEELPRVLDEALLRGREMVCTYNDTARGGKRRHVVSRLGNVVLRKLFRSPVRDAGANFMAVETRFLRGVRLLANDQRYLLPIAMRRGLRQIAEVGCVFELRAYGQSKYSYVGKVLGGIPEMLALQQRLWAGAYDAPPVPPPADPFPAPVARLVHIDREQLPTPEERFAPDDRLWAIVRGRAILAAAGWRQDPWDSDVLARPSGRLLIGRTDGPYHVQLCRLTRVLRAVVDDARGHGTRFLSLRISEEALAAIHAAGEVGFRVIESYLLYARPQDDALADVRDSRIRLARPEDREPLAELAATTFQHHRYVVDPQIPLARARHSRRQWVLNAFAGRADAIYVADRDGHPAGFVVLRSRRQAERAAVGMIDLLAVNPEDSGRGLGRALVIQAIQYYRARGMPLEAGTQGKNVPAIRLYTALGFMLTRTEFSLHWHAGPCAAPPADLEAPADLTEFRDGLTTFGAETVQSRARPGP